MVIRDLRKAAVLPQHTETTHTHTRDMYVNVYKIHVTLQNTKNTITVAVDININYLSVFVKEHFISTHYGVEF